MVEKRGRLEIKGLIILIMLIIIIIGVGMFFIIKNKHCRNIDDEGLLAECKECKNSEDSVDCRDLIYREFAFLKQDLELCEELVQDYRKNECLVNLEKVILRKSGVPGEELTESGGYRKTS